MGDIGFIVYPRVNLYQRATVKTNAFEMNHCAKDSRKSFSSKYPELKTVQRNGKTNGLIKARAMTFLNVKIQNIQILYINIFYITT